MSKIVKIKYLDFEKKPTEEICYLIESNDTIVPKTSVETNLTIDPNLLNQPENSILLEDSFGLWLLNKEDLISMVPASEYELRDFLNRN